MFTQYTGILDAVLEGEEAYRLGIRGGRSYLYTDVQRDGWRDRVEDAGQVVCRAGGAGPGQGGGEEGGGGFALRGAGEEVEPGSVVFAGAWDRGRGIYVGVDADRDIRTMVNLMGILKAGAA